MAIYHLEAKVVSRGAGRSAVAASAYSGIPVCLWCGRAADWGILFSCHALLQYCVYESVSAGIIQTISAGYYSDVLRWSCMAQIGNTGSA